MGKIVSAIGLISAVAASASLSRSIAYSDGSQSASIQSDDATKANSETKKGGFDPTPLERGVAALGEISCSNAALMVVAVGGVTAFAAGIYRGGARVIWSRVDRILGQPSLIRESSRRKYPWSAFSHTIRVLSSGVGLGFVPDKKISEWIMGYPYHYALPWWSPKRFCEQMKLSMTEDDMITYHVYKADEFPFPNENERLKLIKQNLDKYIVKEGERKSNWFYPLFQKIEIKGLNDDLLKEAASKTKGFSAKQIARLMASVEAAAYGSENCLLHPVLFRDVVDYKVAEHQQRRKFAAGES